MIKTCGNCHYKNIDTTRCGSCEETLTKWTKTNDRIICLVGESGSGKTTIAKALYDKGYNVIQSYTTREPRENDEWGHIFTDWGKYANTPKESIIAYTYYDSNHYWATTEQYIGKGDTIYIIEPVGIKNLQEVVKDTEVIVIYLKCDKVVRLERMLDRGDSNEKAHERIAVDEEVFETVKCDAVIDSNGEVEKTISLIEKVLLLEPVR